MRDLRMHAGFWALLPEPEVPELSEAGEQWVPENYPISWHQNAGWEIYFQAAGGSQWETPEGNFTLGPGGYYIIGPGLRHRVKKFSAGRQHYFFVVLDVNSYLPVRGAARALWGKKIVARGVDGTALRRPLEPLLREVTLQAPYRAQALRGYLSALVVEATRLLGGTGSERRLVPVHPGAARAKELIETQPAQPWTLATLSRAVGLSPNYFATIFEREIGETPRQYLLERRLTRARELLRTTDLTIAQLAQEVGFLSSQYFATAYKNRFIRTPRQERLRQD